MFRGPGRGLPRTRAGAWALALAAVLLPLAASTESAGPSGEPSRIGASQALASSPNEGGAPDPTRPLELRVSTSPDDLIRRARSGVRTARKMRIARPALPLTRAAARQQVESVSPADWLEGYGPVTVGQPR